MASTSTEQNSTTRPNSEVFAEKFPSFDHRAQVVSPFEQELKRDVEFIEKLNAMLLELVIDFHAWSAARPVFESDKTADVLEKEVKSLVDTEKEQEKTRQRLNKFITQIKLALVALTGLAPP
ncbi:hypothetical protein K466DRAFT_575339 [Polyporus arcularius HHB13444]|uniref:Uncharacterized protein n=1 Tax=Polyporus arcularius HHB13444 TaxID=1314778 RepID=A0A5C3PFG1_9APHY|nr:hypothetical protein K466DRAFT_575339 [Polyporus arcularius HHB13444]